MPLVYRNILDEAKRQTIVALVANGSSRRVAARFVGCDPSTITRTVARDPEFAAQLARAEHTAEIGLLRSVQAASKMPKHWRAAAWLLERRNPSDFFARPPHLVSNEQMAEMVTELVEALCKDLPDRNYRRARRTLKDILLELQHLREPIVIDADSDDAADELDDGPDDFPGAECDDESDLDDESDDAPTGRADAPNTMLEEESDEVSHLTSATRPPKVEIELRVAEQNATNDASTTSVDVQRPSLNDAS